MDRPFNQPCVTNSQRPDQFAAQDVSEEARSRATPRMSEVTDNFMSTRLQSNPLATTTDYVNPKHYPVVRSTRKHTGNFDPKGYVPGITQPATFEGMLPTWRIQHSGRTAKPDGFRKQPVMRDLNSMLHQVLGEEGAGGLNKEKFWNVWAISAIYRAKPPLPKVFELVLSGFGLDTTTSALLETARNILEKVVAPMVDDLVRKATERIPGFEFYNAIYYNGDAMQIMADYGTQPGIKLRFPSRNDALIFVGAFDLQWLGMQPPHPALAMHADPTSPVQHYGPLHTGVAIPSTVSSAADRPLLSTWFIDTHGPDDDDGVGGETALDPPQTVVQPAMDSDDKLPTGYYFDFMPSTAVSAVPKQKDFSSTFGIQYRGEDEIRVVQPHPKVAPRIISSNLELSYQSALRGPNHYSHEPEAHHAPSPPLHSSKRLAAEQSGRRVKRTRRSDGLSSQAERSSATPTKSTKRFKSPRYMSAISVHAGDRSPSPDSETLSTADALEKNTLIKFGDSGEDVVVKEQRQGGDGMEDLGTITREDRKPHSLNGRSYEDLKLRLEVEEDVLETWTTEKEKQAATIRIDAIKAYMTLQPQDPQDAITYWQGQLAIATYNKATHDEKCDIMVQIKKAMKRKALTDM